MGRKKSSDNHKNALKIFRSHGGVLRTTEALKLGIHPRVLYELRDSGQVDQLMRGVFSLPGLPGVDQPDFVLVSKKIPSGVICLTSALYFHGLSNQIPREVDIAVKQGYSPPQLEFPPAKFHWFSTAVFISEAKVYNMGGAEVKIYSPAKTVVDCFRLRSKVGISIALEALQAYWRGGGDINHLCELAKQSRVLRIMSPYIEAVIHE